jgi:uncharacterized protein with von Willebrand factor type A (vWA) domain
VLRVLSELFWSLRRQGLAIATSQALDAARAVELLGFADRRALEVALSGVLVTRAADRAVFKAAFDDFFREDRGHVGDLFDRLRGRGLSPPEIEVVREVLAAASQRAGLGDAFAALGGTPQDLEWLLRGARMERVLGPMTSPKMVGFYADRASRALGLGQAASIVGRLGKVLEEALGRERGALAASFLKAELDALKRRLRLDLERRAGREDAILAAGRGAMDRPFGELTDAESRAVERSVRRLAEKLRGGARVRARRARRGRIDPRATTRRAARTLGIPMQLAFKRRRDDRPKLVVLCDVSDSVRAASRFMLELVAATSALFERSRSFVFVSELVETTELFRAGPPGVALRRLASGAVVDLGPSSSYERALADAERKVGPSLDRRTVLVVLGDGRTNHRPDGAEILARLRDRCRAVVWICPEPTSQWGLGDSRMNRYREVCTKLLPARTARELEEAARAITRLR